MAAVRDLAISYAVFKPVKNSMLKKYFPHVECLQKECIKGLHKICCQCQRCIGNPSDRCFGKSVIFQLFPEVILFL